MDVEPMLFQSCFLCSCRKSGFPRLLRINPWSCVLPLPSTLTGSVCERLLTTFTSVYVSQVDLCLSLSAVSSAGMACGPHLRFGRLHLLLP